MTALLLFLAFTLGLTVGAAVMARALPALLARRPEAEQIQFARKVTARTRR